MPVVDTIFHIFTLKRPHLIDSELVKIQVVCFTRMKSTYLIKNCRGTAAVLRSFYHHKAYKITGAGGFLSGVRFDQYC